MIFSKQIRIIKSIKRFLLLNKLRVSLSLTGIAVGITAVIIMVSVGEGARGKMLSQINSMGSNLITVDAGKIKEVIGRKRQVSKVTTLTQKDVEAIKGECRHVILAAPTQEQTLLVKYRDGSTSARVIGTTQEFSEIRNYKIAYGRFINSYDNKLKSRSAVIGQKIVEYLFNEGGTKTNPIGETLKINNIPFEIIGVLKEKGGTYDGANDDEVILIPINTGMRRVFSKKNESTNTNYIKNIYVQAVNKEKMKIAEQEIRNVLRERHRLNIRNKEDDFTIQNIYTAIKVETETNDSFTYLITGVAALSLLVGGIGILAIMLLSVRERKPEIGLRMAVGAKPNDILFQFLFEAAVLGTLGGIAGIFAGVLGSYILGIFSGLATQISLQSVIISVVISIVLGLFFGAAPARRASLIEPVTALKA